MLKSFLKLKNKILYKVLFLVMLLFMAIPYFNTILSPYFKIFLVWGGIYIVYDFLKGYRFWEDRAIMLLLAFCAAYGISILVNRTTEFIPNIKALAYMVLVFMLFFGQDGRRSRDEILTELDILTKVVVIVTFVFSVVCFLTFFFYMDYVYIAGDTVARIGMKNHRLWGLYNPNTGGALNVISILLSCGMLTVVLRSKKEKIFLWINVLIQFVCLVLSGSRTSLYALMIGGAAGMFLWQFQKKKNMISCILAAAVVLAGAYLGNIIIPVVLDDVPKAGIYLSENLVKEQKAVDEDELISADEKNGNTQEIKASDKNGAEKEESSSEESLSEAERLAAEQSAREKKRGSGGVLSGRTILWEAGVKAWMESPVFGVTREGMYASAVKHIENSAWHPDLKAGGLHNGYLTALVCSGIIGVMILAMFFIYTGKTLVMLLWKRKCSTGLLAGITFIIVFAVMELMESRGLYQMNIFFVLFWMYYGYVIRWAEMPEEGTSER